MIRWQVNLAQPDHRVARPFGVTSLVMPRESNSRSPEHTDEDIRRIEVSVRTFLPVALATGTATCPVCLVSYDETRAALVRRSAFHGDGPLIRQYQHCDTLVGFFVITEHFACRSSTNASTLL
jgi:hypothetical protein